MTPPTLITIELYMDRLILALCTDLFFQSRISAAAKAVERQLCFVKTNQQLERMGAWDLSLVDLDARLNVPAAIAFLKEHSNAPVIAFGPHLDTEKRKTARAAGADRVLAKSKFVTELPRLVAAGRGASHRSASST